MLEIGEHIVALRRKLGITQEELANYLGVTKASVSKWETKQSYPDILLLPRLAMYFDVTIDELIGYEPQLSQEQIQKKYQELTGVFAQCGFEEAMKESEELLQAYYSCYPLAVQIAALWLNHYSMVTEPERQVEVLQKIVNVTTRVKQNASEPNIRSLALSLEAMARLGMGAATEVVELLEPFFDPYQTQMHNEMMLIQAYQMSGRQDDADCSIQSMMYQHLLVFVSSSIQYMQMHLTDNTVCEETIRRLREIMKTYDLMHLNPNQALQVSYVSALYYAIAGKDDLAIGELQAFVENTIQAVEDGIAIHGDTYFNRLDEWLQKIQIQTNLPRSEKVILESVQENIQAPAFARFFECPEYKKCQIHLQHAIKKEESLWTHN